MCAAFCLCYVSAVVYREEDVCGVGEVWEGFAEGSWVAGLG